MDKETIYNILDKYDIQDENLANALAEISQKIIEQIPSIDEIDEQLAKNIERKMRRRF